MAARYLAISKTSFDSARYRRRTINRHFATGPVTLGVVVVMLVAFLGVVYLVQSNSVATSGYEIESLESRIEELQRSNTQLKLQAAELQSLKHLEEVQKNLNMVPNSQVSYVKGQDKVASR